MGDGDDDDDASAWAGPVRPAAPSRSSGVAVAAARAARVPGSGAGAGGCNGCGAAAAVTRCVPRSSTGRQLRGRSTGCLMAMPRPIAAACGRGAQVASDACGRAKAACARAVLRTERADTLHAPMLAGPSCWNAAAGDGSRACMCVCVGGGLVSLQLVRRSLAVHDFNHEGWALGCSPHAVLGTPARLRSALSVLAVDCGWWSAAEVTSTKEKSCAV